MRGIPSFGGVWFYVRFWGMSFLIVCKITEYWWNHVLWNQTSLGLSFDLIICTTPQVALVAKNLPVNTGNIKDMDSIHGIKRSPIGGNGKPLQYSCLENPMDRGAWWAMVHGITKSQTWLKQLSRHIIIYYYYYYYYYYYSLFITSEIWSNFFSIFHLQFLYL